MVKKLPSKQNIFSQTVRVLGDPLTPKWFDEPTSAASLFTFFSFFAEPYDQYKMIVRYNEWKHASSVRGRDNKASTQTTVLHARITKHYFQAYPNLLPEPYAYPFSASCEA